MSSPFQLLPARDLLADLRGALDAQRTLPLEDLLERHGLLRPLAREVVLDKLRRDGRVGLEEHYGPQVEARFLERQKDLHLVVFRTIRLQQLGLAEELYLRLLDEEESFGDLAARHSLGDERHTRGLMGPLPISQPHPTIRAVLERLQIGEVCPPFLVDQTVLILRLEHRIPARLDEVMQQQLLQELVQPDLDGAVEALVDSLLGDQR